MVSESCLECKYAVMIEYGCDGRLGEIIITCSMCEEEEKECYFEKK